jgi:hypothetical protein
VRLSPAALAAVLLVAACGGSPGHSGASPTISGEPVASAGAEASASPSASTAASPSAPPTAASGSTSLAHCTVAVPSGDNLVIGKVSGDATIVVRDIQDPAAARNLCRFDASAASPQFVSAAQVAYETPAGQIVKATLATGATSVVASFTAGFGSGQYAFSPDGRSMTYIDGNDWHLVTASGNRVLTTLPALPGRGVSPDQDDSYLSYSPDGLYIAWFQTFHTGGSGATAPDQVRRASDGSLAYSTSAMTMAVWSSVPSRLFFRDSSGNVHRWDPSTGLSSMLTLQWIRPRSSPDGRWIAYTFRGASGLGTVGFYSVQSNGVVRTSPASRSGAMLLNNDLVWYIGERACSTCFGGAPEATGVTYIYDIAGASEVVSRLSAAYDAWPHTTAPGI